MTRMPATRTTATVTVAFETATALMGTETIAMRTRHGSNTSQWWYFTPTIIKWRQSVGTSASLTVLSSVSANSNGNGNINKY